MIGTNKAGGWLRVFFGWTLVSIVFLLFLIFFYYFTGVALIGEESPLGGGKVLVLTGFNAAWLLFVLFLQLKAKPGAGKVIQALLVAIVVGDILWFMLYDLRMLEGWIFIFLCAGWGGYFQLSRRVRGVYGMRSGLRRETLRRAYMTGGLALLVMLFPMIIWDDAELGGAKQESAETVKGLRNLIISKQRTISERDGVQKRLDKIEKEIKKSAGYLFTGDADSVAAELNKIMTEKATANSITITRVDQAIKPERLSKDVIEKQPFLADFLKVKVVAYIKCTPDQLAKLLASLDGQSKLAFVERCEIKSFSVAPDKQVNGVVYLATYLFKPEKPEKKEPEKKKETKA